MRAALVAMVLMATAAVAAAAQTNASPPPAKDAAYWQTYANTITPNARVTVGLKDGSKVHGRLVSTTTDAMLIRVFRLPFQEQVERRVPFDAVTRLWKRHPFRDMAVAGTIAASAILLWLANVH